jgi:glycosyltransferase involved in cell wall biosynthesis
MKIVLVNIRYGYVGGPERYLFNLKNLLEENGHEIIPFSIKYPINEPSAYEDYFVSPLSDDESVYFKKQKKNLRSIAKTLERNFYSEEVENNLSRLIEDTKPDFAIVLLYLRKLSPAVLVALQEKNVPFVVRLSDFGMICPSHNFFRGNSICELCAGGKIINSVRYKCVHHSYSASLVNYLATKYHQSRNYFDLIEHFVSPSKFLIHKMIEAGWKADKFHHLPTFANIRAKSSYSKKTNQIIYAGRLEYIKGVHILLEAVRILSTEYGLNVALKLAGSGDKSYIQELRKYCSQNNLHEVDFMDNLGKDELFKNYEESILSVIPSLWYDNLPNSALESLSCGTPIVASAHGCFPELVVENQTGFLFAPGDARELALKILEVLRNPELQLKLSSGSMDFIREKYSPEVHYEILMSIMKQVMQQQHQKRRLIETTN